jgi:integrase
MLDDGLRNSAVAAAEPVHDAVQAPAKKAKAEPLRVKKLTKSIVDKLENGARFKVGKVDLVCPAEGQFVVWEEGTGFSVLVSESVKSYRATYRLRGKTVSWVFARVGEMEVDDARDECGRHRHLAQRKGIDPKGPKPGEQTFAEVAAEYVEKYCKPNQRRWSQVDGALKRCTPLLKRPFDAIELGEVMRYLDDLATKHPAAATVTLSHLKNLWRWAKTRGYVKGLSIFVDVKADFEKRRRERVYSDDEVKAIWKAAEAMPVPVETAFFKVLLLLAPRIASLAFMKREHLTIDDKGNPVVWITPHELTKSTKRVKDPSAKPRIYITPLPLMVQRILKPLLAKAPEGDDLVFKGLPIRRTKDGSPDLETQRLVRWLVKGGAAQDFKAHSMRHTVATWLENEGASEWERGLVLNHSGSTVTAGYSHGHATKLKLELLTKWTAHVEGLVSGGANVSVLR